MEQSISCSPGDLSPANSQTSVANQTNNVTSNNSNNGNDQIVTNGRSSNSITPKIEHSPPEHYERQTVLMWGATGASSASSSAAPTPVNTSSSVTNRSPSETPTTNGGIYMEANHMKHIQQYTKRSVGNSHLKWTGNNSSKDGPTGNDVYQMQMHSDGVDASPMYSQVSHSPHLVHHGSGGNGSTASVASAASVASTGNASSDQNASGIHHSPQSHHASVLQPTASSHHTSGSNSCEVWSPAYSQYQYFTYHHAQQHASTQ